MVHKLMALRKSHVLKMVTKRGKIFFPRICRQLALISLEVVFQSFNPVSPVLLTIMEVSNPPQNY